MEGVGARLGRSSTRYGPATVFTGPVRKWKKKWVHVDSSSSTPSSNHNHPHHHSHLHNASSNGTNGSHLLLYKWTPLTQSQNSAFNSSSSAASDKVAPPAEDAAAPQEPPRRKFKYVPIAVLEEQKDDNEEEEAEEKVSDEAKPIVADQPTKDENLDEKPDINDVPMEENQDANKIVRQDLNESTLDLSLGLNAHDGDNDNDLKADQRDS